MDDSASVIISMFFVLILIALAIGVYFFPSIVASLRNHSNTLSIFILNFFFGFTVLGWIGALIWGCSDNVKPIDEMDMRRRSQNFRIVLFTIIFVFVILGTISVLFHKRVQHFREPDSAQSIKELPHTEETETAPVNTHSIPDETPQNYSLNDFAPYANERFGYRIDYPSSFESGALPVNGDGITLRSSDGNARLVVSGINNPGYTLNDEYTRAVNAIRGQLGYNKLAKTWFVITWDDGANMGYTKEFVGRGSINSFTFTFPSTQQHDYDSTITKIEKSFRAGDIEVAH